MAGALVLDKPYHNLKGIIVSKGLRQKDIAEKLDMDKSTLSMKLNRYRGRDFTFSEASKLAGLLGVKMEDFQQYFFTLKVAKTTTQKGSNMKEIEKNALNDVLRTIMIINNKIEEIIEIQKQQELAISYLRGIMDGSGPD